MNIKILSISILVLVCLASIFVSLPTIKDHLDNPMLIAFFNHDEGYLMDLVWYYFSAEKLPSFQYDCDYGLMLKYLSDLARIIPNSAAFFTPGVFVYILRIVDLIAWLAALAVFWRLIKRHFGGGWKSAVGVILLGSRPAFAYFSENLKPEPLVLFFIILGLDHALTAISSKNFKHIVFAVLSSVAAFATKFAGIFLIPCIVAAIYFMRRLDKGYVPVPDKFRMGRFFPVLGGLVFVVFPALVILFYQRRTTGSTWAHDFGFLGSFQENKMLFYVMLAGISFMAIPALLSIFDRIKAAMIQKTTGFIDEILYYCFITAGLFIGGLGIIGFRWLLYPRDLISLYAQTAHEALWVGKSIPDHIGILPKIHDFGAAIVLFLAVYIFLQIVNFKNDINKNRVKIFKRLILAVFLVPFFLYICSPGRAAAHHMLPFFAAGVVLSLEGIEMALAVFGGRIKFLKTCFMIFSTVTIFFTVYEGTNAIAGTFAYKRLQSEDVIFDIAKWWKNNYPYDIKVVADHPTLVYMPVSFKNTVFLRNQSGRIEQLLAVMERESPRFIYMNMGDFYGSEASGLEQALKAKGYRFEQKAVFSGNGRKYERWPGERYAVYEILY